MSEFLNFFTKGQGGLRRPVDGYTGVLQYLLEVFEAKSPISNSLNEGSRTTGTKVGKNELHRLRGV